MTALSTSDVIHEIEGADRALGKLSASARRLWDWIRITPEQWRSNQYPGNGTVWVVGVLGRKCLYFIEVEEGWGWGGYETWGAVNEYHWEQLEIQQVVVQTLASL
jgi:hypothetical protein